MDNVNCGGSGPHTAGEVRWLSTGGGSNAILCRACFEREIRWRRERNRSLGEFAQFQLPCWEDLKVNE